MKISKPLTKTQSEMASHIITMLKERADRNKVDDVFFAPKEYVTYCAVFDINTHKSRSFIKQLHLNGHLIREKVHGKAYKYTPNGESKAIVELIDNIVAREVKTKIQKSANSKILKKTEVGILTPKETLVASSIQKIIKYTGSNTIKSSALISQLIKLEVCGNEFQVRHFIKCLHDKKFLVRLERGIYGIASKPKPKVEKVNTPSPEIKQSQPQQCLKVTYGEKQIMNTVHALQNEVSELRTTLRNIESYFREILPNIKHQSDAQMTLQNIFRKKSIPDTQRIKG